MKNKTPENKLTNKKKQLTTNNLIFAFVVFFIASFFVATVMAVASGGDSWKTMLFHNGNYTDMYMDFFNSIRDAGAEDVYTARNNIYPPLCLLLFKVMGFMVSEDLVDLPNTHRAMLQSDQRSMMIYILFACICILSMTTLINAYANKLDWKNNKKKTNYSLLISFLMIVSYPVMYCIERGNIIILSMILTMFFVFFRDSENKIMKECSYIALALAAGIKLYPAIFGMLLLFDKKYKDAGRLIIYGIVATIAPFVFFLTPESANISSGAFPIAASISNSSLLASGDGSAISHIIENLLSFATNKKSSLNFSSVSIQNFVFIFDPDNTTLAKIICYITEAIAVISLFFVKKQWQQIFLIVYLMLNIPSASSSYALTFVLIPFIMFLYDDKGNGYPAENRPRTDLIYIICFVLLLAPLPVVWYYHMESARELFNSLGVPFQPKINQVVAGFVYQFMYAAIIVDIFAGKIKSKKLKKSEKSSSNKLNTAEEVA